MAITQLVRRIGSNFTHGKGMFSSTARLRRAHKTGAMKTAEDLILHNKSGKGAPLLKKSYRSTRLRSLYSKLMA